MPGGQVPGGFANWAALYAMQHRLDTAATEIASAGAGQAGIEVSAADRELRVYWPGTVPARVRALAGRLGVKVTFHTAAFSQRTLVAAARQLAAEPGVADAAPKADGSGLTVRTTSAATAKAVTARARNLAAAGQAPLTITIGQRSQALYTRQQDGPPFSGGSRYGTSGGSCTNGFALSTGAAMLSAGHCGSDGQSVVVGLQNGTIAGKNMCRDTLEINYPQGTIGRVYVGWYGSNSTEAVAGGASPDFVGDLVETSGSSSGEHTQITVRAVDVFATVTGIPCSSVGPLDEASYDDGVSCASAPGDSGGPVIAPFGSSSVIGRGTITSGYANVSCPGLHSVGSDTVFYAPLVRPPYDPQIGTLQYYGVSLATG